jgi:site-specific recombinase XerD
MLKNSKPSDFSYMLSKFLSTHMAGERNLSSNTVLSYRDTFKLLLAYLRDEKQMTPEKVTLSDINRRTILDFINWLKAKRGSSPSTCNQRLGAIHAFFEYVQYEMPEKIQVCQDILGTKMVKAPQTVINYLTLDGIKAILATPDLTTKSGRRDTTMLSLLYDTGARVQELADITIGDVRFVAPATIRLVGKGNKARTVPLLHGTEELLKEYLKDMPQQPFTDNNRPLFCNRGQQKFTRWGISYILKKYTDAARAVNPGLIPEKLSPHCLRHSKAMHLLQANVNLIYIRDLLGHTHIKTTEVYARADSAAKREALEKANPVRDIVQFPSWNADAGLMEWLQNFGRRT